MSGVILSGMRPTGELHIGHYVGVLRNWRELQNEHECFFFLADWHALTSNFDKVEVIQKMRLEYIRGWLAAGIDPNKAQIFQQSLIPEILYLQQLFLNMTPPGWAERSPSWKEAKDEKNYKLDHLGFFTYPILQAADIAIVRGELVPVGEDQVSHIEIAREIVRRFNRVYATDLPEPEPKLTKVPRLMGLDGHKKMSSSLGNYITLQETEKSLQKKVNKIRTDDTRGGVEQPGNPLNCTVFEYHQAFSSDDTIKHVDNACRAAGLSCGECKKILGDSMKTELLPIAERISKIADEDCRSVIVEGSQKVSMKIKQNWENIKNKIGF